MLLRACTSARVRTVGVFSAALLLATLGLDACATKSASKSDKSLLVHPIPGRALAGMEGKDLVLTPLAFLRPGDKLGWVKAMKSPRDFLHLTDSLLEVSLKGRAYRVKWVFPEQLRRSADRSAGMIQDPDALSEQQLLPGIWKPSNPLFDPLASQVRSVISAQNSRYVLAPVELRFVSPLDASGGAAPAPGTPPPPEVQLAVLRLALLDAQGTLVVWAGDVTGDTARTAEAATASLTTRLGDLLGTP
jgi:hypothetical protein